MINALRGVETMWDKSGKSVQYSYMCTVLTTDEYRETKIYAS